MCEILISSFIYIPSLQLGQLGIFLNHPPSVVCQHPCAHMNSSSQGFEWLLKRWDFIHIQYWLSIFMYYPLWWVSWLINSVIGNFPVRVLAGHWNDVGTTAAFNIDDYCKQRDTCMYIPLYISQKYETKLSISNTFRRCMNNFKFSIFSMLTLVYCM